MILKIFKSLWFLSMLALLAALLYIYASLPESVVVQEDGPAMVTLSRDSFFYIVLAFIILVNVLVYVVKKFFLREESLRAWFHGLIITINIFFMVALFLINSYNSGERFDYSGIGFVVYGSVALVIGWAAAWPIYQLFKRLSPKSSV
jgi:uncharacterized membrane protein